MRIKEKSKNGKTHNPWSRKLSPKARLKQLNKQFSSLNLDDYLCEYTDFSQDATYQEPSKTELNAIFNDMGKTTPASRCINCSCCGYDTCEQMAKANHNGFNYKENCIHFVKDQVEIEKEHALKLAQEVEEEKDIYPDNMIKSSQLLKKSTSSLTQSSGTECVHRGSKSQGSRPGI